MIGINYFETSLDFFLFGIERTNPTNAPYAMLLIGELVIEHVLLHPIK